MRLIGFSWIGGGILGALIISWLMPIAALPFAAQVCMLVGGNIIITSVVELLLVAILGVKE